MAAPMKRFLFRFLVLSFFLSQSQSVTLPIVVNTWPFTNATQAAWKVINTPKMTAVDAVEAGCSECEEQRCDGTVGWGGDPDEHGETTLDAMIMDGITHDVGAVGALRQIRTAIAVARAVMERTSQTLLVGELAMEFAVEMGFEKQDLHSNRSMEIYKDWKIKNCQPNYWMNVLPNPKTSCGPYKPSPFPLVPEQTFYKTDDDKNIGYDNHDTIGMVVIDSKGNVAGGTSTNGLNHKVPGRVGDSPVAGAGSYVDNEVGGAAATGDGDVMMRFLPSFYAVTLMRTGVTPNIATAEAIKNIIKYYPGFIGAVLAVNIHGEHEHHKYYPGFIGAVLADNIHGEHGAACHGIPEFPYSIMSPEYNNVTVLHVPCIS